MNIRLFLTKLRSFLLELNFYTTGSDNIDIIQNERRSSRFYLILLSISLLMLISYYSIGSFTQIFIIESPSFQEYSSFISYPTLQCSCSKIDIKYEEFLTINVVNNDLCDSDLVSNEWIDQLFILYNQSWNNSLNHDIRRIAAFQFQTLQALCYLVENIIKNALKQFYITEFIQSKLISSNSFYLQMDSLIGEFIYVLPKTFKRKLNFIQNITAQSLIMTGAAITSALPNYDYQPRLEVSLPFTGINYTFLDGSNCICSSSTSTTCLGLATFQNTTIPGFQTGCYMINALLQSTLQAFHNQTFIDILTNSSKTFRKLNSSISTLTIETVLNHLFVSQWLNTTSYERYYNHCSPDLCQYTNSIKHSFLHIITLLIGLFGGLSSTIKILAPLLVRITWSLIQRKQQRHIQLQEGNKVLLFSRWCKKKLITLNLFEKTPSTTDEHKLQQERLITRIYLLFLSISLIILILFNMIKTPLTTFTVNSPTLSQFLQLYQQYPLTLNCPCSQNTIKYSQVISLLEPQFHEICSSKFISSEWINIEFMKLPSTVLFTHDFRSQSQFYFQLLSTLCQMANQTITDSLYSFYRKELISQKALSNSSFQQQINLLLEQYQRTTLVSYQSITQMIKSNFDINQFISSKNTEFYKTVDIYGNSFLGVKISYYWITDKPGCEVVSIYPSRCICNPTSDSLCYMKTIINDNTIEIIIPGMMHTWFPFHSVLISTLECFYNQTCLSYIQQFINSTSTNFTILQSFSSDDQRHLTIASLVNNLFVHSWYNQSSFQSYFHECHPLICQYSIESRLQMIYIFTTIFGLIGGLNIILRFLTSLIVGLLIRLWNYFRHPSPNQSISIRFRSLNSFIRKRIIELDLFPAIPPSQNIRIIYQNRYKTRIYLILLITFLFILLLYTSLKQQTNTYIIRSPTVSQYQDLLKQYSSTLQCSCNHIAIKYHRFILELKPKYHQICSSIFNTPEWDDALVKTFQIMSRASIAADYRNMISFQFRTVSVLCDLTQKIVNSSLSVFEQTDYFTRELISPIDFAIQIETIIDQFKNTIANEFMQTLQIMHIINRGNQLATGFQSNWQFLFQYPSAFIDQRSNISSTFSLLASPKTYNNETCSCATQSNCSVLSYYGFQISEESSIQILPGFRFGCFALNAFLQSNFACLYNQTCLDLLQSGIYYSKPLPVYILTDYSQTIKPHTTIETLINQLFVTEWFYKISFDLYFNECAPQTCQYLYSTKFNQIYVITTFIGLVGGLAKGLHMIVSCLSKIVLKLYYFRKKKREIVPNEHNTIHQKRKDEVFVVGLIFWIIVTSFIFLIVWLIGNNNQEQLKQKLHMTHQTTITTSSTQTDVTTVLTSLETCFTTLKYEQYTYLTGQTPKSLIIADFNKDNILDLAVTNYDNHSLSVLLGNANGTFQTQKIFSTGNNTYPWDLTTGDFNNDNLSDIAVTLSRSGRIAIFYNMLSTDLNFSSPQILVFGLSPHRPSVIESADFDGNGFEDLIVGNQFNQTQSTSLKFGIFLNFNNGNRFTLVCGDLCAISWNVISIAIGDFDRDGKYNEFSICDIKGDVYIFFGLNFSTVRYRYQTNYVHMYENPLSMIRGKFNFDDFDDLAMISPQSDTLQIILAYNHGYIQQTYLTSSHPTSVAKINFNNDHIDDLVVLHCNRTINIFIGTNTGLFDRNYLSYEMNVGQINNQCVQSIKVADFNLDGKDDLVFIDTEIHSIRVLLNMNCNE
ncbi:hypothetical protein I4U23_012340 [Adineta vaga]|nr:hypothetical protein I4U23_012340 [Adineta vaga]